MGKWRRVLLATFARIAGKSEVDSAPPPRTVGGRQMSGKLWLTSFTGGSPAFSLWRCRTRSAPYGRSGPPHPRSPISLEVHPLEPQCDPGSSGPQATQLRVPNFTMKTEARERERTPKWKERVRYSPMFDLGGIRCVGEQAANRCPGESPARVRPSLLRLPGLRLPSALRQFRDNG